MATVATKPRRKLDLRAMTPRPAKPLPKERDRDYIQRWAALLRVEMERAKVDRSRLLARLQAEGWAIDQPAINAWLRGDRMPHAANMPLLGRALKMRDYRKLYPAE